MKRLGIFVFYDAEGVVDDCCEYYVKSLQRVVEQLIIVVNGKMNDSGIKKMAKYARQIVFRTNSGFDAGAYKEVLSSLISEEELEELDELVFSNDTCYGPFVPFSAIFEKMEKKAVDFWGINYIDQKVVSYLESNFLVFHKRVIPKVAEYFKEKIDADAEDVSDVYIQFEIGLFQYLKTCGFRYDTYAKYNNLNIYKSPNFCIKKYDYPFMKKKCFSKDFFHKDNCKDALEYLQEKTDYDVKLINSHAKRKYGEEIAKLLFEESPLSMLQENGALVPDRSSEEIMDFCKMNMPLYIYGAGVWARKIYSQFQVYMSMFQGFIVSDEKSFSGDIWGHPVWHLSELEEQDIGIVVAINSTAAKEVKESLCGYKNVLYLWDV